MAIRRMNYTKRTNLHKHHVQISLGPENGDGVRTFSVKLDLPDTLPTSAMLALEAYNSSPPVRMRYDLGTVGSPRVLTPDEAVLTDFPREVETPMFRFKAIDPEENRGRLIADARQIRPINAADKAETRQGLLYIGHKRLDGLVWDLEVDRPGEEPTLWIDIDADPARELARDPKFVGLVYPEVFRDVLTHLVIDEEMNGIGDEGEWGNAWFTFACGLPGMAGEPEPASEHDEDERRQWIARAIRAFALNIRACELVAPLQEEDL